MKFNYQRYILLVLIIVLIYFVNAFCVPDCNRWHPANHCDALCTHKYGSTPKNDWHILGVNVIDIPVPFSTGEYNKYVCVCDGDNITTWWTCL